MRFSNESGAWSPWEFYTTAKAWPLSAGDGQKQVSVQTSDLAGNVSSSVSAGIVLVTTPPTVSLSINGGATVTNQPVVTLTISAGGAASMRLRNETADWSDWMPVASTASWTLSSGDGQKQVSLEAQDAAGNISSVASAGILLDTTPPTVSLSINGGATVTNQQGVTLTISAGDAVSMRLRNETASWSDWMPAASTASWTLSSGDGQKQVSSRPRTPRGTSPRWSRPVSSSIRLRPPSLCPSTDERPSPTSKS